MDEERNQYRSFFGNFIRYWCSSVFHFSANEKLEQLYSFLIKDLKLDPSHLYATVFAGNEFVKRDEESIDILQTIFKSYGVSAEVAPDNFYGEQEIDISKYRIFPYGIKENWWQRGDAVGELGGPDSETFYDLGIEQNEKKWGYAHPATDSGRFVEIGNSVFMQYRKIEDGWEQLKQKNVDYGGGIERLLMLVQGKTDIFSTDLFTKSIQEMESTFNQQYKPDETNISLQTKTFRVIADHLKAAVFMVADDVIPSSKEQGYILRKAIRRAVKFAYLGFGMKQPFSKKIIEAIIETYTIPYPHLEKQKNKIQEVIQGEEEKFWSMFVHGLEEADKYVKNKTPLDGKLAFMLYETYGFPVELTLEYFNENAISISKNFEDEFAKAQEEHKKLSRVGAEQRFKGGLADTQEVTVRYHTAAHLMLKAMQLVLGEDVHQKGQNITDKRLRFDINFPRPITADEIKKIENLVNERIQRGLTVSIEQMKKEDIKKKGAEGSFMDRYGDIVNVYKMYDEKTGEIYSYEVCGGPHVKNISEIVQSGQFKIIKEESSGAGVRRIKAVFEK